MPRSLFLSTVLTLAGCGQADAAAYLTETARSPDGRLEAQLWCPDACADPARRIVRIADVGRDPARTVTLADSGAIVGGMRPAVDGHGPSLQLPRAHGLPVVIVHGGLALDWTGRRTLRVSAPCLARVRSKPTGRDGGGDLVRIIYRSTTPGQSCS